MKTISRIALAVALLVGAASFAQAAETETTLNGTLVCAKCTLKKADATKCQDVLLVKDDAGATTEYYVVKNAAAEEAGHLAHRLGEPGDDRWDIHAGQHDSSAATRAEGLRRGPCGRIK